MALEAISCATQLDGLVVVEIKGKVAMHIGSGLGSGDGSDVTSAGLSNNQPNQPGGSVTWVSPLVNRPIEVCMTCSGCIIRIPDRLTYAPAEELRYLGEMVELDNF